MKCKSGDLPILVLSFLEEGTFKVLYHLIWLWLRDEVFQMIFFVIVRESLITLFYVRLLLENSAFFDVKKGEICVEGFISKMGFIKFCICFYARYFDGMWHGQQFE